MKRVYIFCAIPCLLIVLASAPAWGTEGGSADTYRAALHGKISLHLTKSSDGGKPTVELAVAWVCKKAGVPYQVERSRLLGKDKVKVRVPPINCTDAVAGRVIVAVAAKGDLKLKIDDKGVYLEPKPEGTDDNPLAERRLSVNERMRFGHLVQLEIDALHGKDIDKRWWGDRDVEQQVQLEITVRGIQAFKGLKLVTYIYARIQRDSLRTDEYREDKRPRYGPNRDFVEIHKQTIPIPVLARMTPQAFNTDAVLLEYEVEDYYYSGKRRYGEKYYGYVVDVYLGNDLIKSVASSAKMHELIGRHKRTGFPIR